MSNKSYRAKMRKEREARKNPEFNKVKSMADTPETKAEASNPKEDESTTLALSGAGDCSSPESTSQSQTQSSDKKRYYSKHIIRTIITMCKIFAMSWNWFWRFLDSHSGGIQALATLAIVALTFAYVKYSKKQWQTMQDTLKLERPWIGPTQRASGVGPTKHLQFVEWHFQNGGRSVATRVVANLGFKIGPTPSPLTLENALPKNEFCEHGRLSDGTAGNVMIPGIDASIPIGPSPDITASLDAVYARTVGLYIVGCIDYSDNSGIPWYRTNVNERYEPISNGWIINKSGNDVR